MSDIWIGLAAVAFTDARLDQQAKQGADPAISGIGNESQTSFLGWL